MVRVLLTGFGPFPGAPVNPSAWLAETLPSRLSEGDEKVDARILPTEWEAVAALTEQLRETLQPHVTVHFGLSHRAKGFRIERSAHNRASLRADASGALPRSHVILPQGPTRLNTTFPANALAAHLNQRSISAAPSRSAGSYLCNFLYYLSLDWAARQNGSASVLFVHIPPFAAQGGSLSEAQLLGGAEAILRFVIADAKARSECLAPRISVPSRARP
jgi:pyroglutamyl-peptidase